MTRVHHTGFTVSNLERSLQFYRDILGLEVDNLAGGTNPFYGEITGYPGAHLKIAFMRLPGSDRVVFELIEYVEPQGSSMDYENVANPGSVHIAFLVDDIHACCEELKKRGVRFKSEGVTEVTSGPYKGGYAVYVLDPDDIPVELVQPPA